jgi:hypothetical protein
MIASRPMAGTFIGILPLATFISDALLFLKVDFR